MSSWCRGRDICTPISKSDEELRNNYGGRSMNYGFFQKFYNHMPATEVMEKIPDLWNIAYKFSVDRHPYDKVLSLSSFRLGRKGDYSKDEIDVEINKTISEKNYLNYQLYTNPRGDVMVDKVFKYEEFWPEIERLAIDLGVSVPEARPAAKANYRKDFVNRDLLSSEQIRNIQIDANREFELFGWDR